MSELAKDCDFTIEPDEGGHVWLYPGGARIPFSESDSMVYEAGLAAGRAQRDAEWLGALVEEHFGVIANGEHMDDAQIALDNAAETMGLGEEYAQSLLDRAAARRSTPLPASPALATKDDAKETK